MTLAIFIIKPDGRELQVPIAESEIGSRVVEVTLDTETFHISMSAHTFVPTAINIRAMREGIDGSQVFGIKVPKQVLRDDCAFRVHLTSGTEIHIARSNM
ncbi:hypothetical protein GII36_03185 [Candidatus Mycosynbacter amalyticus]|uniref:Uncharacterized protein n=1 Tax=Candidatus Mycosynbacter amalyticus TaxID=2665156 RepID=A0A857MJX4_9BACT|nr:hypothetical protein [Candidatus Mycosynbacter amalyticus]QHN42843.1 hypothetical protein GII36_03185 [Candidatus Mycosynbacter amalyticus]